MKRHLLQGNKCVMQSVRWLVSNTSFIHKTLNESVDITDCKSFSVYVWFQHACLNPNLWLCFTWNVKQSRWGGSDSLLVSGVASEQKEGGKVGKEMGCGGLPPPQSEIWWHNWATREPGVCPRFIFSGTHSLKRAPSLGLRPASSLKARGTKVMKWVQERTGIMSWWNREG